MRDRPIPGDPAAETVQSMLDIRGQTWWLMAPGDYHTYAVETMRVDGSQWQRMIAVDLPVRLNHDSTLTRLRFMIDPLDAIRMAENLVHAGIWLLKSGGDI